MKVQVYETIIGVLVKAHNIIVLHKKKKKNCKAVSLNSASNFIAPGFGLNPGNILVLSRALFLQLQ